MALFGPSAVPANKNLLEIKAGQVVIRDKKAVSNKEKGLIYLKTGTDQLVHFCWLNRETKHTLEDFTIIPGDAVFKSIPACKTGRVYALYIPSSKSKHLYWLQDPDKEKDKEVIEKMNQILSNQAPPPESERGHNMMEMLSSLRSSDMFEGVDQRELIEQLLQGSGGANPLRQFMNLPESLSRSGGSGPPVRNLFSSGGDNSTPSNPPDTNLSTGTTDSESTGSISGMDLQNLISGIQLPQNVINQSTPALFTDVLTQPALDSILSDAESAARLETLLPDSPEPLKDLLSSPQFAQAIALFSQGFLSRQLAPLMHEYGADAVTAAQNADLVGLARAIETSVAADIVDEEVVGEGEGQGTGEGAGEGTGTGEGTGKGEGGQDIVDDSDELD